MFYWIRVNQEAAVAYFYPPEHLGSYYSIFRPISGRLNPAISAMNGRRYGENIYLIVEFIPHYTR
jgi:hypothetical protein